MQLKKFICIYAESERLNFHGYCLNNKKSIDQRDLTFTQQDCCLFEMSRLRGNGKFFRLHSPTNVRTTANEYTHRDEWTRKPRVFCDSLAKQRKCMAVERVWDKISYPLLAKMDAVMCCAVKKQAISYLLLCEFIFMMSSLSDRICSRLVVDKMLVTIHSVDARSESLTLNMRSNKLRIIKNIMINT